MKNRKKKPIDWNKLITLLTSLSELFTVLVLMWQ